MHVGPALDQFLGGVLGVVEFSGVDESITALAAASIWALQSLQRRVMSGSCWENGGHRVDIALPRGRRNAQNTVDDESESFGDQRSRVARGYHVRSNPKSENAKACHGGQSEGRRGASRTKRDPTAAAWAMNASPISTLNE